ncbi:MAG: transporter [Oscillospiraceae bacterium]|nr:transporter [Oscillospiraceae bacterium]MBR2769202.1 transporter [Solobacterium sp.]
MKDALVWIGLHALLAVYSLTSVFSKLAAGQEFLSLPFCLYYGAVIVLLGVYAIGWQQVIKRLPLTAAYANKAVTVVWGFLYGILFFREAVTPMKVIGLLTVVAGVVLFAFSDEAKEEEHE